jgi:hypothetical protein
VPLSEFPELIDRARAVAEAVHRSVSKGAHELATLRG